MAKAVYEDQRDQPWIKQVEQIVQGDEDFWDDPKESIEDAFKRVKGTDFPDTSVGYMTSPEFKPGSEYEKTGYCVMCGLYHEKLGDIVGRGPVFNPEHPGKVWEHRKDAYIGVPQQVKMWERALRCNLCQDPAVLRVKREADGRIFLRLSDDKHLGQWIEVDFK